MKPGSVISTLIRGPLYILAGVLATSAAHAQINTLTTFNNSTGYAPSGGVTVSNGVLYGTTLYGQANGNGSVFSLPLAGGTPTTLVTFDSTYDAGPSTAPIIDGSTLYSETQVGGPNGKGTIFSVPVTGGATTPIANFGSQPSTVGTQPIADLTLSNGVLYGTTFFGGASGAGTVFSVPVTGGTPQILATFNGTNGAESISKLILNSGTLYGATSGGVNNQGTVFSVPVAGGPITTLATFDGINGDGANRMPTCCW
jgi:uncharacterized repeat protein (TIGR03803 family)